MSKPQLPAEFVKLCRSVTAKRPKTVIDHILKHGFITTEELKNKYGYNHPPRAVRDVKENGIIESPANTVDDIIAEVAAARVTERGTRADDKASEAAMEDRKKAGYF